jgi:hypothetical protein
VPWVCARLGRECLSYIGAVGGIGRRNRHQVSTYRTADAVVSMTREAAAGHATFLPAAKWPDSVSNCA